MWEYHKTHISDFSSAQLVYVSGVHESLKMGDKYVCCEGSMLMGKGTCIAILCHYSRVECIYIQGSCVSGVLHNPNR